jgi:hypothetical protein
MEKWPKREAEYYLCLITKLKISGAKHLIPYRDNLYRLGTAD